MSVEDRVRAALEIIDSGVESPVQWAMINRLYKSLQGKKKTPRIQNLLDMIEPILAKYGYHKVSATDREK